MIPIRVVYNRNTVSLSLGNQKPSLKMPIVLG